MHSGYKIKEKQPSISSFTFFVLRITENVSVIFDSPIFFRFKQKSKFNRVFFISYEYNVANLLMNSLDGGNI